MTHFSPFCSACGAYFPAGAACPACNTERTKLATPVAPDQPCWRVPLPGAAASRLALAQVGDRRLLLVAWHRRGRGSEPDTGGVIALDTADGSMVWPCDLGVPVLGGAAVAAEAGVAVVGLALGDSGSGAGWVVGLRLDNGEVRWRTPLGGRVEAAPVVDGVRVYVAADDGRLACLDARSGEVVWCQPVSDAGARPPAARFRIPAPTLLISERGRVQAIIVGTYTVAAWENDGKLAAFNPAGQCQWRIDAGGQVRGAPTRLGRRLYVAAYRWNPSTGLLMAYHHDGKPAWKEPFTVQAARGDPAACGFITSPLVYGDTVVVGCQDHRLYAVDAATGALRWSHKVGGGIASAPVWVEGLVVFGAKDGILYAVDAATGVRAWTYPLGGPILTDPLAADGIIYAASDNGTVVALPWHAGRYAGAAERLENAQRWREAGDYWALAATFEKKPAVQNQNYLQAVADWDEAGEPELIAQMWTFRGARWRNKAADAWKQVGLALNESMPARAALGFKRAADLYHDLFVSQPPGQETDALVAALNECMQSAAECGGLPYVTARLENAGGMVQWEASKLTLRLVNQGWAAVRGEIRLTLGGGLADLVEAKILGDLPVRQQWRVPLLALPTRPESTLEIEIEYDSGHPHFGVLRTVVIQPMNALARPRPLNWSFGDVGQLQLNLTTEEGARIQVAPRDVGAIINRGAIENLDVHGDVGVQVGPQAPKQIP